MGGSSWSNDSYVARSVPRAHAPVSSTFKSTDGIHKDLDPKGVKFRESRDSDAHPESNAIAVFFDVTGSMGDIPILFAKEKLGGLMRILLGQNRIPHPQILFGAVGDAYSDRAPLQVGQFESGIEMDDQLTKIYLEGNGGGQASESYELPIYWAAHHVSMDCLEKRGKKGYLFVIGDEGYYPTLLSRHVKEIIGDDVPDQPIEKVIADASEKFEVFRISVASGSYSDGHHPKWRKLMGERAVFLEDPKTVCEFIAAQIAACEGAAVDDIAAGLKDAGVKGADVDRVTKALVVGAGSGKALKKATATGNLPEVEGDASAERL